MQNRQVFYLVEGRKDSYSLMSPYLDYTLKGHIKHESSSINVELDELIGLFEFITIGYVNDGYGVHFYPHASRKREEKFYELKVSGKDEVNIRYIQFYHEYLTQAEKQIYQYSPIFMELYDSNLELVSEGCPKSIAGSKSSRMNSFM